MASKSCWNCLYRKNKQLSLFGSCLYFLHMDQAEKEIPETIVDNGCTYYEKEPEDKQHKKVAKRIIEVFNGKIVEKKIEHKKVYKRKRIISDTRHKYSQRKDWD